MKTFKTLLVELNACSEAKEWSKEMTIEEVLSNCNRGDWLLWLAKRIGVEIRPLTLAKARCAKTVIHLMKDQRSIDAVNLAEKFGLTDEVSFDDLKNAAADAAYAAAAAAAYAADAAYAAAYAADDAYAAAAYAADAAAYAAAAYAADAAAYAAYAADAAYAAADAARTKNQKQTSDICREILGDIIIKLVNEKLN